MHAASRRYVFTWAALMLISALTLALARVPLGGLGTALALALASVKALLIAIFFMHLIEQRSVNTLFLTVSLVLVAAFIALSAMDVGTRGDPRGSLPRPPPQSETVPAPPEETRGRVR